MKHQLDISESVEIRGAQIAKAPRTKGLERSGMMRPVNRLEKTAPKRVHNLTTRPKFNQPKPPG
jgi:hypothetical protein